MAGRIRTQTNENISFVRQRGDFQIFSFDRPLSTEDLHASMAKLAGIPEVLSVEEDVLLQAVLIPNDPYLEWLQPIVGTGVDLSTQRATFDGDSIRPKAKPILKLAIFFYCVCQLWKALN
jgi:hypothetical protein